MIKSGLQYTCAKAGTLKRPYAESLFDAEFARKHLREIGTGLFSFEERIGYLKRYGNHCMSFSMFQPEMRFFDISETGFIAYREKWGYAFTLADPVCDEQDREHLIREFLKARPNACFIQVSEPVARILHERFGFYATQFGVETIVDLESWDLKGRKKQVLRTSINKAHADGVRFVEKDEGKDDGNLTREWMRTRKVSTREISFLIRKTNQEYREGMRKFYALLGDRTIGFIHFDPVYEHGKVIAYVPNISRFSPSFKQGIFYPLMVHAMEVFKAEGVPSLQLGLSPLVVDSGYRSGEARVVKALIRLLYRYANMIYNFKGLHFTKSRFQGRDVRTFCAHRSSLPLIQFLSIFRLCNFI